LLADSSYRFFPVERSLKPPNGNDGKTSPGPCGGLLCL